MSNASIIPTRDIADPTRARFAKNGDSALKSRVPEVDT